MRNTMNEVYSNWPTEPEIYTLALVQLRDLLKEMISVTGDLFERQRLLGTASSIYWTAADLVYKGLKFMYDPAWPFRFNSFDANWQYRVPTIKSLSIHDLFECKLPWDNFGSTDATRLAKAVTIPTFFPAFSSNQTVSLDPIWWIPKDGTTYRGFVCPPVWLLKTLYMTTMNNLVTLPSTVTYYLGYQNWTNGNPVINLNTLLTGVYSGADHPYGAVQIYGNYSGNNLTSGDSAFSALYQPTYYYPLFEQISNFYDRVKVLADFSELFWNCIHEINMKAEGIPFGDLATLTRKTLIMRLYNARSVGRDRENHLIEYLPSRTKLLYDEILDWPVANSYTDDF